MKLEKSKAPVQKEETKLYPDQTKKPKLKKRSKNKRPNKRNKRMMGQKNNRIEQGKQRIVKITVQPQNIDQDSQSHNSQSGSNSHSQQGNGSSRLSEKQEELFTVQKSPPWPQPQRQQAINAQQGGDHQQNPHQTNHNQTGRQERLSDSSNPNDIHHLNNSDEHLNRFISDDFSFKQNSLEVNVMLCDLCRSQGMRHYIFTIRELKIWLCQSCEENFELSQRTQYGIQKQDLKLNKQCNICKVPRAAYRLEIPNVFTCKYCHFRLKITRANPNRTRNNRH